LDPEVRARIPMTENLVAKIGYGRIFGQVALLSNDSRTASILTLEETTLMVIDKKEFDVIKNCYSSEFNERKVFLTSVMPSIDSMKEMRSLMKFLQYFEVVTFSRVSRV